MKLCVLGSGSKGNAVLIQAGETRILVDAGFAPRAMEARLLAIGVDPLSIEAVLLTHEHIDHARGAASCSAKWGWKVFATGGTQATCEGLASLPVERVTVGEAFSVGDIGIDTATTSHDATDPIAIVATGKVTGARAAIVYDLGAMTDSVMRSIQRVDVLVIESNHDSDMLRNGPYPLMLQRRIAGRQGHLSNGAAGRAACECAHRGLTNVVLAHLSATNNSADTALSSMQGYLSRSAFRGSIAAARQDIPSPTIRITGPRIFAAAQLSLAL